MTHFLKSGIFIFRSRIYRCPLCSVSESSQTSCEEHVKRVHCDWKEHLKEQYESNKIDMSDSVTVDRIPFLASAKDVPKERELNTSKCLEGSSFKPASSRADIKVL